MSVFNTAVRAKANQIMSRLCSKPCSGAPPRSQEKPVFAGSARLAHLFPIISLAHFLLCPLPTAPHTGLLIVPGNSRHSHTSGLSSGYSPCLDYLIHTSEHFIPSRPLCFPSNVTLAPRATMTTHLKSHPPPRIPDPSDLVLVSPSPPHHSTY